MPLYYNRQDLATTKCTNSRKISEKASAGRIIPPRHLCSIRSYSSSKIVSFISGKSRRSATVIFSPTARRCRVLRVIFFVFPVIMSCMVVWLTPDKVQSLLTVIFSFSHMVSSLLCKSGFSIHLKIFSVPPQTVRYANHLQMNDAPARKLGS